MNKKTILAIFIWIISICFFFYEFFLRIVIGTIANFLIEDLSLTTEKFSILGACYYLTYAIMQIPVGYLVDRLGARILLTFACFVCSLGVFLFSISHSFLSASISRLLIGFGSSFAFVCCLVLAINWFQQKHFGFISGIAQFLGAIGPLLAGGPLAYILKKLNNNWRLIFDYLAIFGFILTVIIFFFIRNKPKRSKEKMIFIVPKISFLKRFKKVIKNRQIWFIISVSGLIYVSIPLLSAYFGVTYLEALGFDKTIAASIISFLWIGYAIACPIYGKISDIIKRRKPILIFGSILGVIASFLFIFFTIKNIYFLSLVCFLIGVSGASSSLTFALISENVHNRLKGTGLGINNTSIMLFAAVIPSISGFIMQYFLKLNNKTIINATYQDLSIGLMLMPILFLTSFFIVLFFIHETFCSSQMEIKKISRTKILSKSQL
jgi:MFS family permease